MFKNHLPKLGISCTFVDVSSMDKVRSTLTPQTKLVWIEPCTNPTCSLVDVEAIAKVTKEYNVDILVGVDNTFLTPYAFVKQSRAKYMQESSNCIISVCIQKPLGCGADLVFHSISKYLNGHSDVLMGCLLTNMADLAKSFIETQKNFGLTPSSFDAYLVQRALNTLEAKKQHERFLVKSRPNPASSPILSCECNATSPIR